MSNILDTLNQGSKYPNSYYDASEFVRFVPGQLYPANAVDVRIKEVDVKKKYKALVYNVTFEIADACKELTFTGQDNAEIKGSSFVGRKVKATGIFQFLVPEEGDTFEPNHSGNERYFHFCESLGVECPTTTIKINGAEKEVRTIPTLSKEDILGKPVKVFLDNHGYKDYKTGELKTTVMAKSFSPWVEGSKRDLAMEDLPF
jgi:hypothetical protein